MNSLDFIERETLRRDLPPFRVGDAVRVHVRVKEGDKERIQVFEGLVIRRRGTGSGETFTVRKIASGVGVERIFPVQSQLVTKVEIKNRGFVRRSRLYYLRNLSGKKARLQSKVRDLSELVAPDAQDQAALAQEAVATEPEVVTEAKEEVGGEQKLTGKARKRAKAKEKAERMKIVAAEEAEKQKQREAEEAKQAAEEAAEAAAAAKAEEEAASAEESEAPAAEAAEEAPAAEATEEAPAAEEEEKKD
jgi:large subunit ribosomal protein L19